MADDQQKIIADLVAKHLSRTEEERQQERQKSIEKLTLLASDPTVHPRTRARSAQRLIDIAEDVQVENLYKAVNESPNPDIAAGADPLIKMFMNERAEMLHQQQKLRTIGTPDQFFEWLSNKPRFK